MSVVAERKWAIERRLIRPLHLDGNDILWFVRNLTLSASDHFAFRAIRRFAPRGLPKARMISS